MTRQGRSRSVEIEGKTPEAAIEEGLAQLGVGRDEAEVEVLDEGKSGFMGLGSKNARVRVTSRAAASEADEGTSHRSRGAHRSAASEDDDGADGESSAGSGDRAGDSGGQVLDPAVETILRDVLVGLVRPLDAEVSVQQVRMRDGRYDCEVAVSPENLAVVLGRRGRTLDAIQTLAAALATRRAEKHVRVILDCGGFREKRREVLVQMAHDAAAEAVSSGDEIHLEPMSAHDRKIVHATLSAHDEVETSSEDSGDHRHIVVRVKGSAGSGRSRSRSPRGDRGARGHGRGGRGGGRPDGRGGGGRGGRDGGRGGRGGRSGGGRFGGGRGSDRGPARNRPEGERDGNRAKDYEADNSIPDDIGNRAERDQ